MTQAFGKSLLASGLVLWGLLIASAQMSYAGDRVVVSTRDSRHSSASDQNAFYQQDRDGDGTISPWEWQGNTSEFYRLDTNHDGAITYEEYSGQDQDPFSQPYVPKDAFSATDRDRNLVITPDEWTGSPNDFYALDTNRDGALSRSEFFGRGFGHGRPRYGDETYGEDESYNRSGQASPTYRYSSMDADGDGFISLGEWKYDRASFDRLDKNHNGELSRDELPGSHSQSQSQNETNQPLQTLLEGLLRKR